MTKRDELEIITALLSAAAVTATIAADRAAAENDRRAGELLKLFAVATECVQRLDLAVTIAQQHRAADRKRNEAQP